MAGLAGSRSGTESAGAAPEPRPGKHLCPHWPSPVTGSRSALHWDGRPRHPTGTGDQVYPVSPACQVWAWKVRSTHWGLRHGLPAAIMGGLSSSTWEARSAHQNGQSSAISLAAGMQAGGYPTLLRVHQAQQGLLPLLILPRLFAWLCFHWIVGRDCGHLVHSFIHSRH